MVKNLKIKDLSKYYADKGKLTIVGLNDSQGVNTTSVFRKGLLEYMAAALKSKTLDPQVINAFSLVMNKTEHIDYLLKNNLTLEEIKLSQLYGAVDAFEKVMRDIHLPQFLGKIGYAYKLPYRVKKGDEDVYMSTALEATPEPIVVYSSGPNNIMRIVGANPFGITGDYKNRDKKPNYNYALAKSQDTLTIKRVIGGIERNFNNILSINDKTDICAIGAYTPKSLEKDGMQIFGDLVIAYNEALAKLCKSYGAVFIDTTGQASNTGQNNFHVNTKGHKALANGILESLYERKLGDSKDKTKRVIRLNPFEVTSEGVEGVIDDIASDYETSCAEAVQLMGYEQQREFAIADEHLRENAIFQKVLEKTANK